MVRLPNLIFCSEYFGAVDDSSFFSGSVLLLQ